MELHLFHTLIALHIVTGTLGAIAFWVPVLGKKGGESHKRWGRVFTVSLLATGVFATLMSLLTLYDPYGTHPHLVGQFDAVFIRDIFGWMMLLTALLTINLTWYGWLAVRNRRAGHLANRSRLNMALQWALLAASANCAARGWLDVQVLMIGIALVGVATFATNMRFLRKDRPGPADWLKEHIKALVGSGISVYTAFLAFGSVRVLPELALSPAMWAVPLVTGVAIIVHQQRRVTLGLRRAPSPA